MSPSDHPVTRRFIEEAGNTTQSLGVGRVVGQIYAFLYFSEAPRTLDDMRDALGISKGSASMGVRQLEQWGAVQKIWVKGDRKDFYTANDYFGQIIRNILSDIMGKRLENLAQAVEDAEGMLGGRGQTTDRRPKTEDHGPSVAKAMEGKPQTTDDGPENAQPERVPLLGGVRGGFDGSSSHGQPTHPQPLQGGEQGWTNDAPMTDHRQPITDNSPFLLDRIQRLRAFQDKVNKAWNNPIVRLMLK